MKKSCLHLLFPLALIILFIAPSSFAQKKKGKDVPENKDKKETKSIAEVTKKAKKIEGLFTLYQDSSSGAAYLLIKKEQIGKEYIYFSYTEDGILAAGHFRGNYRDNKIFTIKKYFNKIEFVAPATGYYFDSTNALSRAAEANLSPAILVSQTIFAEDKDKGEYLIKADEIFLNESLHQVKPSPNPNARPGTSFSLGNLSKEKTKYTGLASYPMNTDIVVEYVYENALPSFNAGKDIADDRYVSVKLQHSLIELPKNNYKPRRDDPRVGYFNTQFEDMTSASVTPYHDFINRWNLEKKDKNALLSEPVEPITWWIENTTPVEYRETIKAAALTWNEGFEAAGFKNAIAVKEQPADAGWDAGDLRYNVLRWTSSPNPPFGGYGPSFANPLTGQILGADIMLEFIYITNRLKAEKVFESAALNLESETPPADYNKSYCSLGNHLHQSALFGLTTLVMNNAGEKEVKDFIKEALYYLILHEMGHTFGLNHNMKASQLYSNLDVHNKELTSKTGLTGSVMDYPSANFSPDPKKQGQYFTTKPGPYDKWVIEYGYSAALDNPAEEEKRLQKILSRSTEPSLMFGNDADDMRSPGRGIDPRVMINDMSSDAITYSMERIRFCESIIPKLREKFSAPGQSHHSLRNSYLILSGEISTAAGVISRYIGGVYVDRGFIGQPGAGKPFSPVAYKDQKRAMEALAKHVFAPGALPVPADLYQYLQMQRRGFGFSGNNEDPKIHNRVINIQSGVLNQLVHPAVLLRISDSELYGNQYKLSEFMNDLTNAIFKDDLAGAVNTFRQNLQNEYVDRMIRVLKDENNTYDNRAQSSAYTQLRNIERMLTAAVTTDNDTKLHRQYVLFKIKKAFETK